MKKRLSSDVLLDEENIETTVSAMAQAIATDTPEETALTVVTIMDGAFMFSADLVRRLPMQVHLGFVKLVSIDRGGQPDEIVFPEDLPLRGADVLVIEDILDTGRTMEALALRLRRERPSRLRLAILLDKPSRRAAGIRPDYVGFTVDDRWVVGYGLDHEGLYRNLPYITFVE
jgi:hypoxanthine phosphoribosyltransferase